MTTPVFSLHTEGMWWVDPGWTLCPPVMLYNSSSSAGQGETTIKGILVKIRTGRDHY